MGERWVKRSQVVGIRGYAGGRAGAMLGSSNIDRSSRFRAKAGSSAVVIVFAAALMPEGMFVVMYVFAVAIIAGGVLSPIMMMAFPFVKMFDAIFVKGHPDVSRPQIDVFTVDHADVFVAVPDVIIRHEYDVTRRLYLDNAMRCDLHVAACGRGQCRCRQCDEKRTQFHGHLLMTPAFGSIESIGFDQPPVNS